jgi:amino acid permease
MESQDYRQKHSTKITTKPIGTNNLVVIFMLFFFQWFATVWAYTLLRHFPFPHFFEKTGGDNTRWQSKYGYSCE